MLSSLLLAAASSHGFLTRGMAFGPYDPALHGLSNELPYVSPDLFVVSTSNYMDSSACSNSSTTTSPSWCMSISHDSQRELVLYPQKSMPNQLPNFTRFASLRKLMITGAATDVLRPVCGLSAFIALAARVDADHHAFAARTLFELAPRLGSALALSLSHDSQIELVLYPQKSMRDQLSNVTSFAYLRKAMITGAAADVRRPASGLSNFLLSTSVYADLHALAARILFIELAPQRVHALDHHALAARSLVTELAAQRVNALDHHALAARIVSVELAPRVLHANHHALQGDSVPPADSSTATTPSIYQDKGGARVM